MKRSVVAPFLFVLAAAAPAALLPLMAAGANAAPPVKTPPAASSAKVPDPPSVGSLNGMLEKELKWGMTHAQVTEAYNGVQGFFEQEYAPLFARTQPGSKYENLRADLQNRKLAFAGSWTQFGENPTGYDSTPLKPEYTYKNNEGLMRAAFRGKTRYFFFIGQSPNERLWKVYDEIPLKADGPLGATYQDAVAKIQSALNVAPRTQPGVADWQDTNHHLRIHDRGANMVGVVLEERSTLNRLDSLRPNKAVDPFALDPTIAAITKRGVSDPNAGRAAPSASASAKPARH
jgi:hypothetical protein